jgi:hypothetical protein
VDHPLNKIEASSKTLNEYILNFKFALENEDYEAIYNEMERE